MKSGCFLLTRRNSYSTGDKDSDIVKSPPVEEEDMLHPHHLAFSQKNLMRDEIKIIEPTWGEDSHDKEEDKKKEKEKLKKKGRRAQNLNMINQEVQEEDSRG
jgi:hypothetical protein